jgi:hypothetical protein
MLRPVYDSCMRGHLAATVLGVAFSACAALAACGTDHSASPPITFQFGPYTLQPQQDITTLCVQYTLDNDEPLYVNSVRLNTGLGFHHSNWFWVPEHVFPGPHWNGQDSSSHLDDGTFTCTDRNFDQGVAALFGGVVTAQSTQTPDATMAFPPGIDIVIPAHSKIVGTIHLLNTSDGVLSPHPYMTLTREGADQVTTKLAAMSFENQSIALPPMMQSSFTVDCDLAAADQPPPTPNWPAPDFHVYYALAHYHQFGTGMQIEALREDDQTSTMLFQTSASIGDSLGAQLEPTFEFTGYNHLRFTCDYYNSTGSTITWGEDVDSEMCVFLAFTDSPMNWGGGVANEEPPGPGTMNGDTMTFSRPCLTIATQANVGE